MLNFSTLTPEEFIRLNQDSIPEGMVKYFDELAAKVFDLEKQVKGLKRDNEIAWEQQSFAEELVSEIKIHIEGSNSKIAKAIRLAIDNSQFET